MGLAADIKKKIEKKVQQIRDLELQRDDLSIQIREASAALQAFQEILKITPNDGTEADKPEPKIRPGSIVALALETLRKHESPMHVTKLLEAMGKHPNHDQKVSLSSSLSAYVRDNKLFTRPEPNVFGLREWSSKEDPDLIEIEVEESA
jgi:hypothetical protein